MLQQDLVFPATAGMCHRTPELIYKCIDAVLFVANMREMDLRTGGRGEINSAKFNEER